MVESGHDGVVLRRTAGIDCMNALPHPSPPKPGEPQGSASEAARLLPLIYDELRGLAAHYLRAERPEHTLRPTELVHEAYLRLAARSAAQVRSREHFFALAAQAMRRILVDHARRRGMAKRGGGKAPLRLDQLRELSQEHDQLFIELDDALLRLADLEPELVQVVELRFFGGLTIEETARVMGVSPKTVGRRWELARSWLHREIMRP